MKPQLCHCNFSLCVTNWSPVIDTISSFLSCFLFFPDLTEMILINELWFQIKVYLNSLYLCIWSTSGLQFGLFFPYCQVTSECHPSCIQVTHVNSFLKRQKQSTALASCFNFELTVISKGQNKEKGATVQKPLSFLKLFWMLHAIWTVPCLCLWCFTLHSLLFQVTIQSSLRSVGFELGSFMLA